MEPEIRKIEAVGVVTKVLLGWAERTEVLFREGHSGPMMKFYVPPNVLAPAPGKLVKVTIEWEGSAENSTVRSMIVPAGRQPWWRRWWRRRMRGET